MKSRSISKIKENKIIEQKFCFKEVPSNEIKKIITSLNTKKLPLALAFQFVF